MVAQIKALLAKIAKQYLGPATTAAGLGMNIIGGQFPSWLGWLLVIGGPAIIALGFILETTISKADKLIVSLVLAVCALAAVIAKNSSDTSRPQLHLTFTQIQTFVPTQRPDLVGVALYVQIWNTGRPSLVNEWTLSAIPNGGLPISGWNSEIPNVIEGTQGLLAKNSLIEKLRGKKLSDDPVEGYVLFYFTGPQGRMIAPHTDFEISAKDSFEKEAKAIHSVDDLLHL